MNDELLRAEASYLSAWESGDRHGVVSALCRIERIETGRVGSRSNAGWWIDHTGLMQLDDIDAVADMLEDWYGR